jgi:hypothetical protein
MTIQVNTRTYEASHGHTPRQPWGEYAQDRRLSWAFRIDRNEAPVVIRGTYQEAVTQAKQQAKCSITVLP